MVGFIFSIMYSIIDSLVGEKLVNIGLYVGRLNNRDYMNEIHVRRAVSYNNSIYQLSCIFISSFCN